MWRQAHQPMNIVAQNFDGLSVSARGGRYQASLLPQQRAQPLFRSGRRLCCRSGRRLCCRRGRRLCCRSGRRLCCRRGRRLCCRRGRRLCYRSGRRLCRRSGRRLCCRSGRRLCCHSFSTYACRRAAVRWQSHAGHVAEEGFNRECRADPLHHLGVMWAGRKDVWPAVANMEIEHETQTHTHTHTYTHTHTHTHTWWLRARSTRFDEQLLFSNLALLFCHGDQAENLSAGACPPDSLRKLIGGAREPSPRTLV